MSLLDRWADSDQERWICAHTRIMIPALVPEIRLHLSDAITPIWEATETWLDKNGLAPPFWAFCWPGGQAVARYCFDHAERFYGRSMLDLGAGCGVISIAGAHVGACVTANDIDKLALVATRLNATLNDCTVDQLVGDIIGTSTRAWDIIVAGDMFFEQPMARRLEGWLRQRAAEGSVVLVGDPGRFYLPKQGLEHLATYAIPTSLDLEDRVMMDGKVWRLRP